MLKKIKLKQTISIILLLVTAGVFIYFAAKAILPGPKESVAIVIPEGSSVNDITKILEEKEIVTNGLVFKFYVFASGETEKLLPGRYILNKSSAYRQIIADLVEGPKRISYKVTIPEGFTLKQIGKRLSKTGGLSNKEFTVMADDSRLYKYDFLKYNKAGHLEGYLFPETYTLDAETQVAEVINMMLRQFEKEYKSLKKTKTPVKLDLHQIVTVASLVEREAKLKEERPFIAGVIYNRLKKKMKLEIDATIQYALKERKKKITLKDLEIDSPYNTYKHVGLPPSPIGSPGIDSLKAALNPAKRNYLYYVLVDEKTGKHFFTNNYQEFLKVKHKKGK
ncbi:hypothetical protein LCGC14_1082300 [marine sediment metagenome]|uniref:Endolytic murein transglycosylase n=1 Tax=marine sediment metagenome TaxID=412755 RepID=A0A0F9N2I9_9ZZZZ|nr:endolytic transglycosylase MltG [Actinomycetota bacterium]